MNYDAWRTETPEDEAYRLHTHERGVAQREARTDGFCRGCGDLTEHRFAGWCCTSCQAKEISARVTRAAEVVHV